MSIFLAIIIGVGHLRQICVILKLLLGICKNIFLNIGLTRNIPIYSKINLRYFTHY
jgi:hypothetical protein